MNFRRNLLVNTAIAVCQVLLLVPALPGESASSTVALPNAETNQTRQSSGRTPPQPKQPESEGRCAATLKNKGELIYIVADQCEVKGKSYFLHGNAQIDFRNYIFYADEVTYDSDSGEATASGNVKLDGGDYNVHMESSHSVYNVTDSTGKFYDVHGTTGLKLGSHRAALTTSSPFTFRPVVP